MMATDEINEYYDATAESDVRPDLKQAVEFVDEPGIAIDCGCGAGSDIAYLLASGFTVHAFDIEAESISRCSERFKGETNLYLSQDGFNTFSYPAATLIHADASLFFCPENEFNDVWCKIEQALTPNGIFVGSFLGLRDTMLGSDYQKDAFWPDVLGFTEDQLRPVFHNLEIISWTEHEVDGVTAQGAPHHWHVFSVIARKNLTRRISD
jgi:SAM-dependent methyltransferase